MGNPRLLAFLVVFLALSVPAVVRSDGRSPAPAPVPVPAALPSTTTTVATGPAARDDAREGRRHRREQRAGPRYRPSQPVLEVAPPVAVTIPAIGVSTPLLAVDRESDGTLQVPEDPNRAGWFTGGPRPGEDGPAVVVGHVDSWRGAAIFYRLRELQPGHEVLVSLADGRVARFVVQGSQAFPKSGFPTDAVFGPTPTADLRLITCHGAFDRAVDSYVDNLVVFTTLAGPPEPAPS